MIIAVRVETNTAGERMDAPCKDCPDRMINCHATCEKYKAYDKERQEIRKQKERDAISYLGNPYRQSLNRKVQKLKMKGRYK